MGTDLRFREATNDDALVLSVLASQVFLDTYATAGLNLDLAREVQSVYSQGVFESRLARENVEIIVAEQDGYVIAFVDMTSGTHCPTDGIKGLEIFRLYVQAHFHGQGIGRKLMAAAEQRAAEQGRSHLWLTAWSGNHKALGFYTHLGFYDAGGTEYIIEGKSYENRVMARQLPQGAARPLNREDMPRQAGSCLSFIR